MNETHLVWIFAVGFPLFFVAMWLLVTRILSFVGWSKYLPAFAWDRPIPADAERFSWATMVIGRFPGGVSYKNAMNVWLDQRGIYLRPPLFFSPVSSAAAHWLGSDCGDRTAQDALDQSLVACLSPRRTDFDVRRRRGAGDFRPLAGPSWRQASLTPLKQN
jgi:hypothetical protein